MIFIHLFSSVHYQRMVSIFLFVELFKNCALAPVQVKAFLCLVLVEPKALCYRAYVCVRNRPSVDTSEPKEAKVSHSNRKTLNITLPDVLVNKIQNYDLDAES